MSGCDLRLHGRLRDLAGGQAAHRPDGDTVGAALRDLERGCPALAGWILDERGHVRRHINVFVNGEYGHEATPVGAGDRVEVLPAISGGA